MLDVRLCCGGVGGEWVGDQVMEGWCYVWANCESGLSV